MELKDLFKDPNIVSSNPVNKNNAFMDLTGATKQQVPGFSFYQPPTSGLPTGGSTGGSTGNAQYNQQQTAPTPAPAPTQPSTVDSFKKNVATNATNAMTTAQDQAQDFISDFTAKVSDSFKPVYDFLDSQIGAEQAELNAAQTPGIQAGTREEQVQNQYQTDLGGLGSVRDTAQAGLGGLLGQAQENFDTAFSGLQAQAESARGRALEQNSQNLRGIDEQTRNLTTSSLRRLGAAGDSSAAVAIQQALSRENLRARGRALGFKDQALESIENAVLSGVGSLNEKLGAIKFGIEEKRSEIENVYAQGKAKLDGWKTQTLNNLVNVAQERLAQLQSQKANASQAEQSQLLNLEIQTKQDLTNRLRQLEDEVRQYNTGIDQWAMQRAAALEDYGKQLSMAAQYGGSTSIDTPDLQYKTVPVYDPQTGNIIGQQQVVFNPATGQTQDAGTIQGQVAEDNRSWWEKLTG